MGRLAFSLLPFVFVTLTFFYVTLVLVVTTFATVTTGDGTPEVILMGHCFPIFSVLLWFQLHHTTTAEVAVRGMTTSPLVIDRLTVEVWGCTCFRFNLIHGTQVTPSFVMASNSSSAASALVSRRRSAWSWTKSRRKAIEEVL